MNVNSEESLAHFNLRTDKRTILVIGGSLGALTINESIVAGIEKFNSANLQLIWQTGKGFFEKAKTLAASFNHISAHDFIMRMDFAYSAADLIISRAGAISISELCLIGKPCILVPSPNVSEDHQTKNALTLVDKNAAVMIKDQDARNVLVDETIKLMMNEPRCSTLKSEIKKLGIADADQKIVDEIMKLLQ